MDVIFTSCATESNNAAIAAVLRANPAKRHIVTSQVEHSSVLNYCMALEKSGTPLLSQEGAGGGPYRVTYLPAVRDGLQIGNPVGCDWRPACREGFAAGR